jgi:hypothetical protein
LTTIGVGGCKNATAETIGWRAVLKSHPSDGRGAPPISFPMNFSGGSATFTAQPLVRNIIVQL